MPRSLRSIAWSSWACLLLFPSVLGSSEAKLTSRKTILIDTDIFSDVDDVGALALANVFHNCGLINLTGVAVSSNSKYGAIAVSAINTYYGSGALPLAARRPLTNETFFDQRDFQRGEFASKIANNFPRKLNSSNDTETPLHFYRKQLAAASTNSITLVTLGPLTNIAALLKSGSDNHSPLTGSALINDTVQELVVMGGWYPEGGLEWNFAGADEPAVAAYVVDHWPASVPMTFLGAELGQSVISATSLKDMAPEDSPILAGYEWYGARGGTARASYDPLTVWYAAAGIYESGSRNPLGSMLKSPFVYGNLDGRNEVMEDGKNQWVNDHTIRNQHWLQLRDGLRAEDIAANMDEMLAQDGRNIDCKLLWQAQKTVIKEEL